MKIMRPDPYSEIRKARDMHIKMAADLDAMIPPQIILSREEWANLPESVRNHLVTTDTASLEVIPSP